MVWDEDAYRYLYGVKYRLENSERLPSPDKCHSENCECLSSVDKCRSENAECLLSVDKCRSENSECLLCKKNFFCDFYLSSPEDF